MKPIIKSSIPHLISHINTTNVNQKTLKLTKPINQKINYFSAQTINNTLITPIDNRNKLDPLHNRIVNQAKFLYGSLNARFLHTSLTSYQSTTASTPFNLKEHNHWQATTNGHCDIFTLNETNIRYLYSSLALLTDDIKELKGDIDAIGEDKLSWENYIKPLEEIENAIENKFLTIQLLVSISDKCNLKLLDLDKKIKTLKKYFQNDITLYHKLLSFKLSPQYKTLPAIQKHAINIRIKNSKLNGIELSNLEKEEYQALENKLHLLIAQFYNNAAIAAHGWERLITDQNELSGLPLEITNRAQKLAEEKGYCKAFLFKLNRSNFQAILKYSKNKALREEIYKASISRASSYGMHSPEFDNTPIIYANLMKKTQMSQLLGYENYAEIVFENSMSSSSKDVMFFLTSLIKKIKPKAIAEFELLKDFTFNKFGVETIDAHDVKFYTERMKKEQFKFTSDVINAYFPTESVLLNMFKLAEKLFNLNIIELPDNNWHSDIRSFQVFDENRDLKGTFFTDLFTREGKITGANTKRLQEYHQTKDSDTKPMAILSCNFIKEPTLSHQSMIILFHEFGHTLHHLLSQNEVLSVSGIKNIPMDFVELPSQMMEHWLWQPTFLIKMSNHIDTQLPLPKHLCDDLIATRHFQSATTLLNELESAMFDMRIHTEKITVPADIERIQKEIQNQLTIFKPKDYTYPHNSDTNMFCNGYSACLYSYLITKVMAADAFSKFEEEGIFNSKTGKSFMSNILEKGASENYLSMFKRFRGRAPSIIPFLKYNGIIQE